MLTFSFFYLIKTTDDVVYILRKMDDIEGWPVPLKCYVKVMYIINLNIFFNLFRYVPLFDLLFRLIMTKI